MTWYPSQGQSLLLLANNAHLFFSFSLFPFSFLFFYFFLFFLLFFFLPLHLIGIPTNRRLLPISLSVCVSITETRTSTLRQSKLCVTVVLTRLESPALLWKQMVELYIRQQKILLNISWASRVFKRSNEPIWYKVHINYNLWLSKSRTSYLPPLSATRLRVTISW